jgi:hypothetical protein
MATAGLPTGAALAQPIAALGKRTTDQRTGNHMSETPYQLFLANEGGFLAVELPDGKTALPYIALREIKHHPKPERIVLEFADKNIEVHGAKLTELFELLATMKVKKINVGETKSGCKIANIKLLEG